MAPSIQELGLDRLEIEDRLQVAEAIWDSVVAEIDATSLTAEQQNELQRRWEDCVLHPDDSLPWETVKERLLARIRP